MGLLDKLRNKGQQGRGSAKETAGRVSGDGSLQAEGRKDRASGSLKDAGEKVKDAFR